jgi:predicted nucleic acid-binding protein
MRLHGITILATGGSADCERMAVFADTHFFIALLSARDSAHAAAIAWQPDSPGGEVVTTSWVLVELADSMSLPSERAAVARFISRLRDNVQTRIVPVSEGLLWRGFELYRDRSDKEWSLTDCISFVVMADERISYALTGAHRRSPF